MAIKYKAVLKTEPGVPGGGVKKYYAQIVYDSIVTVDELVKEIEKFSALSEPDIHGVIIALENVVQDKLLASRIVRFNRLGNLYPRLHSRGVDTEEEVLHTIIKRAGIRYLPGDRLKALLKATKYTKVETTTPPPTTP
jgi:predicted histone-like DNA-binding protein